MSDALKGLIARLRRQDRSVFRNALIMPDGRRFGDAAVDFQREHFQRLDSNPGKHSYTERGRGGSKTFDLALESTTELFLKPGARIDACAADRDQAALLHEAIVGIITRTPGLTDAARIEKWSIEVPALGSRLEVLASDSASAYGRTPATIAVDEFAEWREGAEAFWHAIWSSVPKARARVHIISSPGLGQSGFAWRIRETARTNPERWIFSQLTTPPPWLDDEFLAEQRATLPSAIFERLYGGVWATPGSAFLTAEEVAVLFTPRISPREYGLIVVGGDLALTRDSAVLAAVALAGRTQFSVLEFATFRPVKGQPVDLVLVKHTLRELLQKYRATAVLDPFQGELLASELRREGFTIETYPFTSDSRMQLFMRLFRTIRTGQLKSEPHEQLRSELLNLQVTETPGGTARIDHRHGRHDDHVVAVSLALHQLEETARRIPVLAWLPNDKNDPGYWDPLHRPLASPLQRSLEASARAAYGNTEKARDDADR